MKKSHRKDVIIARIIFAAILLVLAGMIVLLCMLFAGGNKNNTQISQKNHSQAQTETESQYVPATVDPETQTQETQVEEKKYVEAIANVNLRESSDAGSTKLAVVNTGDRMLVLGEENGFVRVDYNGTIGFVYKDYVKDVEPESTETTQQ